ncbi:MAG: cache domain-containing protein, partial [Campylobacteraceae bacterium]|nr:cache domain-containing protein [Campylobacteraceae bacterium]
MTSKRKTQEEKNISKIVLLGSTITIVLVSFTIAFILIKLQIKEFKTHLSTFKKTLIQREKFTIKSAIQNLEADILYEQKNQENRIKQGIKNQTEIAKRITQSIYLENKKESRSIILKKIKNAIQNISINKENIDYFIFDKDGTYLLNTRYKSYIGENFIDFVDLNNKKFIKEIIDTSDKILLLPRPRRFGKTLNLSMLRYFFENKEYKQREKLFKGLKIYNTEIFKEHFGKYPVIFLTLKDLKDRNFNDFLEGILKIINSLYDYYKSEVYNSLTESEKIIYDKILKFNYSRKLL